MKFIHTESTIIEITENVIDLGLGDTFFKEFSSDQSFTFKNVPLNTHKTLYITAINGLDSYRAGFKTPLSSSENYGFAACPEWVTKIDMYCDGTGDIQLSILDTKVFDMGVNINSTTPGSNTRTSIDANGYLYGTNQIGFAETGMSFIKKDGNEADINRGFMTKFNGAVNVIQRSNDNKYIYVGGAFTKFESTNVKGIARFYADTLTLDRTFMSNVVSGGSVLTIYSGTNTVSVGGSFTSNLGRAKNIQTVDSSGALTKMGLSSYLAEKFSDGSVYSVAISGNYAYIAGTFTFYGSQSVPGLIKVNLTNLSLDSTFSSNITTANTIVIAMYDIKVINAGSSNEAVYLLGSFSKINGTTKNSTNQNIVKISKDGILDTSFNPSLTVYTTTTTAYPNMALNPSGDVYVSEATALNGVSGLGFTVVKINGTTGATDSNFKINSVGPNDVFKVVYNSNDGYIYGVGSFTSTFGTYTLSSSNIVKIDATTGIPDLTFNIKLGSTAHSLIIDSYNNLYVSGIFSTCTIGSGSSVAAPGIVKINLTTNTKDVTFSPTTGLTSSTSSYCQLKLATNGDLLIYVSGATIGLVGYNGGTYYVARVNSSTGIIGTGSITSSIFTTTGSSYGLIEYNSTLFFCNSGSFSLGNSYNYYAVLNNSDGLVSSSFNPGTNFNNTVRSISGGTMFGGDFTSYNGTAVNYLCSISLTGQITNYNANGVVRVIVPISDYGDYNTYGSYRYPGYFVGGDFTSVLGSTNNKIVAIKNDGTIYSDFNKFGTGFSTTTGHGIYDIKITSAVNTGTVNMVAVGLFTTFNASSFGSAVYLTLSTTGGTASTSLTSNYFGTGTTGTVYTIVQDSSLGSSEAGLFLGGNFTTFNSVTTNRHLYFANSSGYSSSLSGRFNKSSSAAASVNCLFTNNNMSNFYSLSAFKTTYYLAGLSSATALVKNQLYKINLNKNVPSISDGFLKYGTGFYGGIKDGNYVYLHGITSAVIGAENGWPTTVTIKSLTRVNATTGEVDTTFNNFITSTGFNGTVTNLFKVGTYLYVVGQFTSFNGTTYKGILRINIDASTGAPTLDTTFNSNIAGNISNLTTATNSTGAVLYVASNNSIYINAGGGNYLYKINATTGAIDTSFLVTMGATIYDIVTDNTYIYIAHNSAYSYNGVQQVPASTRITKINLDGTVVATYATNGYALKLIVDGFNLYAGTSNNIIYKFDISGTNLSQDTTFVTPSSNGAPFMYNIFLYGNYIYAMESSSTETLKNGITKTYIYMIDKNTGQTKRGLPDLTNF